MPGPLTDIRVLDLSRVLAGPWAGQCLADLGAEVIKIEKPAEGDDTRGWGPPFIVTADGRTGDAAYYLSTNRGKQSVAVDIARPEGQEIIRGLAKKSDILIENFKVGGLGKYGLDYASLKTVNPRLIYCSITGFGQTGPLAPRPGYDFMIQGLGGIMSINGQPEGTPGAEPLKSGVAFADLFTGLYSTIAILAALLHRDRTDEGQHIDMALLDCQVAVLANQALSYLVSGTTPVPMGNAHMHLVPYQTFETADGHIIVAVGNDRQYRALCRLTGCPELAEDPRFATNRDRVVNRKTLIPLLAAAFRARGSAECLSLLEAATIPCGAVNTIDQVFAMEQVKARGVELHLTRADGTPTPGLANPIKYSRTPLDRSRAAPALGADTDAVLARLLALPAPRLAELRAAGVIG